MKTKKRAQKRPRKAAELAEALRFVVRLADDTAETGGDAFTNLAEAGDEARRVLDGSPAGQNPGRRLLARLAAGPVIAAAWSWSAARVLVLSWTGPAGVLAWGPPFGRTAVVPLRAPAEEAAVTWGHAQALAGTVHQCGRLYRSKAGALVQGAEAGAVAGFAAYVAWSALRTAAAVARRSWRNRGVRAALRAWTRVRAVFWSGCLALSPGPAGRSYRARPRPGCAVSCSRGYLARLACLYIAQ